MLTSQILNNFLDRQRELFFPNFFSIAIEKGNLRFVFLLHFIFISDITDSRMFNRFINSLNIYFGNAGDSTSSGSFDHQSTNEDPQFPHLIHSDDVALITTTDNQNLRQLNIIDRIGDTDNLNKQQDHLSRDGFESAIPNTVSEFKSIDAVKKYLNTFCIGDGLHEPFKGFCFVTERSNNNRYSFCCDRGGVNKSSTVPIDDRNEALCRNSTTRKTECKVRIVARRCKNTDDMWMLEPVEVMCH